MTDDRFRVLVENLPQLIWMSDADMGGIYFNPEWTAFTGRSLPQLLDSGWTEGLHPDDRQDCIDTYTAHFNSREMFIMEFRLSRFDAEYRWMLCTAIPWFTPDGKFAGYNSSVIDITERKQAEDVQEQLLRQLHQTPNSNTVGSLPGSMVHDFNNILASIMGYSSLALMRFVPDKQGKLAEYLQEVYQAGVRAKELVAKTYLPSQDSNNKPK